MKLDEKLIGFLWDRFDGSEASELVIETEDGKFSLKKENKSQTQTVVVQAPSAVGGYAPANGVPGGVQQQDSTDNAAENGCFVRSPLPGTFYRAASPDDEPFVIIGKRISRGDVIGIVESMKMMNEIVSEYDGTVAEIFAENGSMVGYDEKLIRLEV